MLDLEKYNEVLKKLELLVQEKNTLIQNKLTEEKTFQKKLEVVNKIKTIHEKLFSDEYDILIKHKSPNGETINVSEVFSGVIDIEEAVLGYFSGLHEQILTELLI